MKHASLLFTVALAAALPATMSLAQTPPAAPKAPAPAAAPAPAPAPAAAAPAGKTLQTVKDRGSLICGVSTGLPGFSNPDDKGNWTGLDVDVCRALGAAILNDPAKVTFVQLNAANRFAALTSGEIDVLSRNTTWTLERDTKNGFNFAGVTYYDGQGFMVKKEYKISSALQLSGASFCVQSGTTNEQNLYDYFNANNIKIKEVLVLGDASEVIKAYEANRCDVFSSDMSQIASLRLKLTKPEDSEALPEVISKEPLGPLVRQNDDQWFDIVKWTMFAMINAEELNVTQANVTELVTSAKSPELKRLLGTDGNLGEGLGLTKDWVVRITKAVGNYGESFERNVGPKSRLGLPRGVNRLWSQGGILYAPPIR